jgi:hypothetical protein
LPHHYFCHLDRRHDFVVPMPRNLLKLLCRRRIQKRVGCDISHHFLISLTRLAFRRACRRGTFSLLSFLRRQESKTKRHCEKRPVLRSPQRAEGGSDAAISSVTPAKAGVHIFSPAVYCLGFFTEPSSQGGARPTMISLIPTEGTTLSCPSGGICSNSFAEGESARG